MFLSESKHKDENTESLTWKIMRMNQCQICVFFADSEVENISGTFKTVSKMRFKMYILLTISSMCIIGIEAITNRETSCE